MWSDSSGELLKQLTAKPKEVFQKYGVTIPDTCNVQILPNSSSEIHFVVPMRPNSFGDLADEDIVELYRACPGTQLDFAGGR
ncbi:hypothetical protein D3C73_1605770 [compost metagenome]